MKASEAREITEQAIEEQLSELFEVIKSNSLLGKSVLLTILDKRHIKYLEKLGYKVTTTEKTEKFFISW